MVEVRAGGRPAGRVARGDDVEAGGAAEEGKLKLLGCRAHVDRESRHRAAEEVVDRRVVQLLRSEYLVPRQAWCRAHVGTVGRCSQAGLVGIVRSKYYGCLVSRQH